MLIFNANPILKWAGGKQNLAQRLIPFFPNRIECYFEPFIGGGSVLFGLMPARAVIGDMNDWLLDTYEAVRTDYRKVAKILNGLVNSKSEFLRIRGMMPNSLDMPTRAAHLIYLNKTCFRGLFRVNRKGQFNVPFGQYDRRYYDADNLQAVAGALEKVEIRHADFELCLHDIAADDFVYMDPPYYKLGGYSDFNRYTSGQFKENDHIRLAALCRELDMRGVRWAVSNSDTQFVLDLFDGYRIERLENRREINLNSQNRDITELLIMNYDDPNASDTMGNQHPE
ncbi:DNA adenine methylase [soil metagenome]